MTDQNFPPYPPISEKMKKDKAEFLKETIEHFDIKKHNAVGIVEAMSKMSFSARELARASDIYDKMLADYLHRCEPPEE